jgi:hypothetical protein
MEDKNWPPFFPIIHHDIANEIPANAQKLQYLAFASWLGTPAFLNTWIYIFISVFRTLHSCTVVPTISLNMFVYCNDVQVLCFASFGILLLS